MLCVKMKFCMQPGKIEYEKWICIDRHICVRSILSWSRPSKMYIYRKFAYRMFSLVWSVKANKHKYTKLESEIKLNKKKIKRNTKVEQHSNKRFSDSHLKRMKVWFFFWRFPFQVVFVSVSLQELANIGTCLHLFFQFNLSKNSAKLEFSFSLSLFVPCFYQFVLCTHFAFGQTSNQNKYKLKHDKAIHI